MTKKFDADLKKLKKKIKGLSFMKAMSLLIDFFIKHNKKRRVSSTGRADVL